LIIAEVIADNALVDSRVGDGRGGNGQGVLTDTNATLRINWTAVEEPANPRFIAAFVFTCVHQVVLTLDYLSVIRRTTGDLWQLCKTTSKTHNIVQLLNDFHEMQKKKFQAILSLTQKAHPRH
jgi:hypothetical protein